MRSNVQIQTVLRQGKIKELLLSLRLITSYYHRRGQDHIMGSICHTGGTKAGKQKSPK